MKVIAALLIVCGSMLATPARAVTPINFDTDPNGDPIPNGTALDDVYAVFGVHFSHAGTEFCGFGTTAYANSNCQTRGPISAPNMVTTCDVNTCSDISENSQGLVRAAFTTAPVDGVCIDVLPFEPGQHGVLRAYDVNNVLVDEAVSSSDDLETICVAASGKILYVEFSGLGGQFAWFDNLEIRFDGLPTLPATLGRVKAIYR